jgi:hypothetical protein
MVVTFHFKALLFVKILITTYLWLMHWKNFICDMKIIKLFIWFTNIVQSMWNHMHEINITNFIKVKNNFNFFLDFIDIF